jgi:hypothetical protein
MSDDNSRDTQNTVQRTPRRYDNVANENNSALQKLQDAVREMVLMAQNESNSPVEINSRTDVPRYLKVASINQEDETGSLLINTDIYIPGKWFIRRQWRPLGNEEGDDYFLKSARNTVLK